jgi:tetratricopeptide (TPR) repeat protein
LTGQDDQPQAAAGEQPGVSQGDQIFVGDIEQSEAVAIGRGARATINNYTEIIVKADSIEDLPPAPGEPPFKGLAYFTEQDADLFFGREELSDQIVNRLLKTRFLAVIGASGSGKSSLLRAGIIPRIRRKNWLIKIMTPTSRPLERLATLLTAEETSLSAADEMKEALVENPRALLLAANKMAARADAGNLLLVVDQFEELFTLCRDENERQRFVDSLLAAVAGEGALTILIGLRADFYDRCADYEGLRDLVSQQQEFIGPMRQEDLVRVIAEPAKRGGWQFVDGLVEQILEDVGREPGRLPLLSHALLETWELRRGTVMTLGGYRAAGGVEGAIAKTAENLLQNFDAGQLNIVEHIFLSLTELGQQAEDTRRIATRDELIRGESQESVAVVLEDLVRARLVTIDGEQVEVAHEALIRRWPRLGEWLEENRERLQFERQLRQDVQRWEVSDRDPGYLYRGSRLQQTLDWLNQQEEPLAVSEQEFIAASRAIVAEEEQRASQLQAAQKRQRLLLGVAAVLVVAVVVVAAYSLGAFNMFREPEQMQGGFNIAVALMEEGEGVPEDAGTAVSTRIGSGLEEALADFSEVEVWYDSPALRRSKNVVIGEVGPDGDPQQTPQAKAESLNADALIYGSIVPSGNSSVLQLQMYVKPKFGLNEPMILAGLYQFTQPVPLFDPLQPGLEIQKPVEGLAQMALGLNFSQLGQAEDALDHFQQAADLMPRSDIAYYFVGQEQFHLSDSDTGNAAERLDEAEAAFLRALDAFENARARSGLGVVSLDRAQALLDEAQAADCTAPAAAGTLQDALAELDAAQEQFLQIPNKPVEIDVAEYGGPITGIVHLNQAILHRIRANLYFCLGDLDSAMAESKAGLAELEAAEPDFQQVSYIRSLARLYQARGTLYHWLTFLAVQQQDDAGIEALQKGIQAYGQCLQQGELAPVDQYLQTVIIPLCEDGLAELEAAAAAAGVQ